MGNETKESDVKSIVAEANRQLMVNINSIFLNVIGCDSECAIELLSHSRNNIDKEYGRNRLSLKRWCSECDYNHRCVYDILQDDESGLGWIAKPDDSTYFKITAKGMREIYGDYDFTQTPIMTIIEGSVYIDETHENFDSFVNQIITHKMFESCGGYNEVLKSRKLMFSKNEIMLAKELGIKLGFDRITDETKND